MYLMKKDLTGDPGWDCAWMSSSDRVHAGYTVHFFNEACRMGHQALRTSRDLRSRHFPVLALEGGKDQAATVFQPEGRLKEYIKNDLGADYKYYPEGHHMVTAGNVDNGKGGLVRNDAVHDIVRWLDRQKKRSLH
jgi:hypothetical protein